MNDPGAEGEIDKAEQEMESTTSTNMAAARQKDRDASKMQAHDYQDPSLWWFASTGCPLIAGTLGPLANAFSICALALHWRVYVPPTTPADQGIQLDAPPWLDAVNAVSLFLAVVANISLLLNMSKRLRFSIAQPLSIIGFFLAGVLLLITVCVFSSSPTYELPLTSPAAPSQFHALTGAFYFAIQAVVLYFIVTALMCLTVWGVWAGHYEAGFRLTVAQRTLMLQTMSFIAYLMLGALVYSHVEGWNYLDALYWANLTLLPIGLGTDFAPSTHTGRSLLFFFALGGIIIIGLVIGSIRTLVLDRGARKLSARTLEKKRLRAINSVSTSKNRIKVGRWATVPFDNSELDPTKRRHLEFYVMRKVQDYADKERKWMALFFSSMAAAVLWFVGAWIFKESMKPASWSYFDALYFSYVCLTTIGYGDLYPTSDSGRAFFVLWTLLAVPTLTILISDMSDTVVAAFSDVTIWIGSLTVLPGEHGFRASLKTFLHQFSSKLNPAEFGKDTPPGLLGETRGGEGDGDKQGGDRPQVDDVTVRIAEHFEEVEFEEAELADGKNDSGDCDLHFYHVVLAREIRRLMRDQGADPPKRYSWHEWEYFLRLMEDVDQDDKDEDNGSPRPQEKWEHLVPPALRSQSKISKFKRGVKGADQKWTWLGEESPLLSYKSETVWILERLGTTLERELRASRRGAPPGARHPPISLSEMIKRGGVEKWRAGKEKDKEKEEV